MGRNGLYPESVQSGIPRLGKKPIGWITKTFGEILEVVSRPAKLEDHVQYQLVTAKRNREGIILRAIKSGKDVKTKTQFYVKSGDFLISRRQIVHGGCGIVPPELDGSIVSNEYLVLHAKQGLNQDYLRWLSHSIYFQQSCFHSSIGVHIEKMVFRPERWFRVKINIPSEKIQNKIVDIILNCNSAVERTKNLINAKRKLKRGLIQNLFGQNLQFLNQSEKWKTVYLNSIGKCIRGVSYAPDIDLHSSDSSKTIRLLRAGNIADDQIIYDGLQYVNREKVQDQQILRDGDLVICMSSGSKALVGKTAQFKHSDHYDYTVGAFCSIFRPVKNERNLAPYLFQNTLYKKWISTLIAGSSINNLTPKDIERFSIFLPGTNKERDRIAFVLKLVDREINILCKQLSALKKQERVLTQKLLSGKLKVVV